MNFEDRQNMTVQQLFDLILSEARKDPRTCRSPEDNCFYRKATLLKDYPKFESQKDTFANACWVGRLIPDEKYHKGLEGKSGDNAFICEAIGVPSDGEHSRLLSSMQCIHDRTSQVYWEREIRRVANLFDLQYNPDPVLGF